MLKRIAQTLILLAGSIALPAQQDYTYVVDEDFVHYENIFKQVEGLLWTENNQIIVSAQWHVLSNHHRLIRLQSNGSYDPNFGTLSMFGGGGGCFMFLMVI